MLDKLYRARRRGLRRLNKMLLKLLNGDPKEDVQDSLLRIKRKKIRLIDIMQEYWYQRTDKVLCMTIKKRYKHWDELTD